MTRMGAGRMLLRVALVVLLAASIPAAQAYTEKEIGSRPSYALPAIKTASGGIRGNIPIGYIGGSSKRNGAYFLPKGYQNKALPVFVFLHGSGGSGQQQLTYYKPLADKYKFIIIAPDSHNSLYWFPPANSSQPFTEDYYHILACYRWVQALPNVKFDKNKISMGGNSRGGYSAASIASCTDFATHSVIIHSRFIWQQMGAHIIPIWVSTGYEDPLFSPSVMRSHLEFFHSKRPEFKYTFRVFSGGHSMNNKQELEASIRWWLTTPGARAAAADGRSHEGSAAAKPHIQ